jgi:hypothetical protein
MRDKQDITVSLKSRTGSDLHNRLTCGEKQDTDTLPVRQNFGSGGSGRKELSFHHNDHAKRKNHSSDNNRSSTVCNFEDHAVGYVELRFGQFSFVKNFVFPNILRSSMFLFLNIAYLYSALF